MFTPCLSLETGQSPRVAPAGAGGLSTRGGRLASFHPGRKLLGVTVPLPVLSLSLSQLSVGR